MNEVRPDQLEIGKVYRVQYYGPGNNIPISSYLAEYGGSTNILMKFRVVARGSLAQDHHTMIDIPLSTSPRDNYYWRIFQTAEDSVIPRFKQNVLQNHLANKLGVDPTSAWGLSAEWFVPKKPKKGGRKYKTRRKKLTIKSRRRTSRRRR